MKLTINAGIVKDVTSALNEAEVRHGKLDPEGNPPLDHTYGPPVRVRRYMVAGYACQCGCSLVFSYLLGDERVDVCAACNLPASQFRRVE